MQVKKMVTGIAVAVVLAAVAGRMAWKWTYPFGYRPCCLACMRASLLSFARDHDGWFPKGGKTDLDALRQLCPDGDDPALLAGISGDEAGMAARLAGGGVVDESVSSWVYFPGLRWDDDQRLALLWERQDGIGFNGHRLSRGSHAVAFVSGIIEVIPGSEWDSFMVEQKKLRQQALASRTAELKPESDNVKSPR